MTRMYKAAGYKNISIKADCRFRVMMCKENLEKDSMGITDML